MFECSYCYEKFSSFWERECHNRKLPHHRTPSQGRYYCRSPCSQWFNLREDLQHHVAAAHPHGDLDRHVGVRNLQEGLCCFTCRSMFDTLDDLDDHWREFRNHNVSTPQNVQPREEPRRSMARGRVYGRPEVDRYRHLRETLEMARAAIRSSLAETASTVSASSGWVSTRSSSPELREPCTPPVKTVRRVILTPKSVIARLPVYGPPTLQQALDKMAAELEAAKSEIKTYQNKLNQQTSLRKCSLCYERNTNFVVECGHQFCLQCFQTWDHQCRHESKTPCPMCRKPIRFGIKFFDAGTSSI